MGVCALCRDKADLINSHLIPAAAYKHVRGAVGGNGDSPVIIDGSDKTAFQTDKQITQYLLCKECEDRFSRNGERILGKLWSTRRGFPLLEKLAQENVIYAGNEFSVYGHETLDSQILECLFYFAVSIFWRAHVWDWGGQKNSYGGALGEKYETEVRRFLLGDGALKEARIFVHLNTNSTYRSMIRLPSYLRKNGVTHHSFSMLGIDFWLYVGGSVGKELKSLSQNNMLFASSDFAKTNSLDKLAGMLQTNILIKGKLAKRGLVGV